MWIYEKRLEYPVNITKPDLRMAKLLMAQYGGPDSELGAALRYLTQRYSMPDDRVKATLTDIGVSEEPFEVSPPTFFFVLFSMTDSSSNLVSSGNHSPIEFIVELFAFCHITKYIFYPVSICLTDR